MDSSKVGEALHSKSLWAERVTSLLLPGAERTSKRIPGKSTLSSYSFMTDLLIFCCLKFLLTAADLALSQMEVSLAARFLQLFLLSSLQMLTNEEIALQPTVNISSDTEDIHQNIPNAVGEIEKESEDWLTGMFRDWGLPG
ncbi:hypothetical protein HGM15179_018762 [Zosterops borbonicus]|uniref:Uncharacterized protein n=1 Tax=Zosterops borbonicus TaxID=364589 RepID=A0A8K1FYT0_9PASS|nr:hypothetical protein HGM15179_018762 [Zosterops borbonicus]